MGVRVQRSLSVMAVLAAFLTGCFLFDGGEPKTASNRYTDLVLRLWISRDKPRVGQALDIRFTVTNDSTGRWVIELPEASVMDIKIGTGGGSLRRWVYWSDDREITPEMRRLELAPGESKTIEMTWVPSKDDQYAISTPIDGILRLEGGGVAAAGTTINVGGYRILP